MAGDDDKKLNEAPRMPDGVTGATIKAQAPKIGTSAVNTDGTAGTSAAKAIDSSTVSPNGPLTRTNTNGSLDNTTLSAKNEFNDKRSWQDKPGAAPAPAVQNVPSTNSAPKRQ